MHDENKVLSGTITDGSHYAEAPIIKGQAWSTMLDGWCTKRVTLNPLGNLGERVRAASFAWCEGITNMVPVWTPAGEARDLNSGLFWGYTVLTDSSGLHSFQLVVFVKTRAERMGHDELGTFHHVEARFVSAWKGPYLNRSN